MRITRGLIIAVVTTALALGACGGKGDGGEGGGEAPATPKMEMVEVDLTAALKTAGREAEAPVVILAPKGAKVAESFGSVEVDGGPTFHLSIDYEAHDLAQIKKSTEANDVQKHQGYAVNEADAMVAEAKAMGRTSFFMTSNVKVGDETFGCQSNRGAKSFDKAAAMQMLEACKTMKPGAAK